MTKFFIAMLINLAFLLTLSNIEIRGISTEISGQFSDTSRIWYFQVGGPLIFILIINVSTSIFFSFDEYLWIKFKQFLCKKRITLQVTLNKLFEGEEFDISMQTAQALAFLFLTMIYCGGLPLLLPIFTIYLILKYWIEKYKILRIYKKPPRFDEKIHK
jgi:hypothetical protein